MLNESLATQRMSPQLYRQSRDWAVDRAYVPRLVQSQRPADGLVSARIRRQVLDRHLMPTSGLKAIVGDLIPGEILDRRGRFLGPVLVRTMGTNSWTDLEEIVLGQALECLSDVLF